MRKQFCIGLLVLSILLTGCDSQKAAQEDTTAKQQPVFEQTDDPLPAPIETEKPETQPEQVSEPAEVLPLDTKIICVDPGHGVTDLREQEPYSPYSSETKQAFVGGTAGRNQTEEELNLAVGLQLKELLEAQGADVIMTRTTHESDMTNYKRALLANEENADLCIRIHADGSDDPSVYGMSMLVPYGTQLATQDIVEPSRVAGEYVLQAAVAATGAKNNGIVQRSNLTGFNFAEVPTILIEMGFMSNAEEDALMETEAYQKKLAQGICDGILQYFEAQ